MLRRSIAVSESRNPSLGATARKPPMRWSSTVYPYGLVNVQSVDMVSVVPDLTQMIFGVRALEKAADPFGLLDQAPSSS